VRDFIDVPVKRYSSGCTSGWHFRLRPTSTPRSFADEVRRRRPRVSQAKCLARIGEMVENGKAVVFVSHDVAPLRTCATAAWC
jgi:ABC-type polysaccharide/polyol phosphate transport system ATPase subunit